MRFTHISVENFRGLTKISIKPDKRTNVIVGPNAIGKTTLLEAIRLLKALLAPRIVQEGQLVLNSLGATPPNIPSNLAPIQYSALAGDATKPLAICAEGELNDEELQILLDNRSKFAEAFVRANLARDDERAAFAMVQFFSSEKGRQVKEEALVAVDAYLRSLVATKCLSLELTAPSPFDDFQGKNLMAQIAVRLLDGILPPGLTILSYFPADRAFPSGEMPLQIGSADAQAQLQAHLAQPTTKYQRLKQTILSRTIAPRSQESGLKEEFARIFDRLLPGKELDNISVSPYGLFQVHIKDRVNNRSFDIDSMSAGEKGLILTFLLIRCSLQRGGILLIDEPELHLNAAVCRNILPFLIEECVNKLDLQAFVCTHSPDILASAYERDDCNLFHLRSGADVSPIYKQDKGEMFEALRVLGASTADVLFTRGSIFVEGEHDVELLEAGLFEIVSTYKLSRLGGRGDVEREFKILQRAEGKDQVDKIHCFIFDLDNRLTELASSQYVKCLQWDRYCLENYLLEDKVLYDVLKDVATRKPESRGALNNTLVELAMGQLAEHVARRVYTELEPENAGIRGQEFRVRDLDELAALLSSRLVRIADQLVDFDEGRWKVQFVSKCRELDGEIRPEWQRDWRKLCDGKRLIHDLYRTYEINMEPLAFKKRVMKAMKDEKADNWRLLGSLLREALKT